MIICGPSAPVSWAHAETVSDSGVCGTHRMRAKGLKGQAVIVTRVKNGFVWQKKTAQDGPYRGGGLPGLRLSTHSGGDNTTDSSSRQLPMARSITARLDCPLPPRSDTRAWSAGTWQHPRGTRHGVQSFCNAQWWIKLEMSKIQALLLCASTSHALHALALHALWATGDRSDRIAEPV